MATPGSFSQFHGPFGSIVEAVESTAGLHFLAAYIPAIDELDRSSSTAQQLSDILAPSAVFSVNNNDTVPAAQVQSMFDHRFTMLSKFSHSEHPIRALDLAHIDGTRSVICEFSSVSVFKADTEQTPIHINELLLVELAPAPEGKGISGLWATHIKGYMDPSPVQMRAKEVMSQNH